MEPPRFVFDDVWVAYRAIRADMQTGGVRALPSTALNRNTSQKSRSGPRLSDFCADFELVGTRSLSDPHLASRLILFRVFYVGLAPYEAARRYLGISELTWVSWTEQIRELVGEELQQAGLFPVRAYFRERARRKSTEAA